ncbi:MAG TPA: siderophore-interacting protein [Solirubrobacteraceae bacterium]|jgi:NADPH-dependent ferric siderophore reductase|nr:siderophore-interacting protein [Solirubrobacteraceae bacterium]
MPEPRQRPPRRNVAVQSVAQITPRLRRLVARGELEQWDPSSPGAHFKVFVPEPGSAEPAMRTYTVRRFEPGSLTIDFADHSDGPATVWARTVQEGAEFQISGMARSGFVPDSESQWCLFLADHAALPAVAAILESLPMELTTLVLIELQDPLDALQLESDADLEIRWLTESGAPCHQLVAAARELTLPDGSGEIWVGCEAGQMRQIRAHMLGAPGVSPRSLHTRAYWKHDVSNHSDHDTGEDDE